MGGEGEVKKSRIQPYSLSGRSSSWQKNWVFMRAGFKFPLLSRELGHELEDMQLYCKPVTLNI